MICTLWFQFSYSTNFPTSKNVFRWKSPSYLEMCLQSFATEKEFNNYKRYFLFPDEMPTFPPWDYCTYTIWIFLQKATANFCDISLDNYIQSDCLGEDPCQNPILIIDSQEKHWGERHASFPIFYFLSFSSILCQNSRMSYTVLP